MDIHIVQSGDTIASIANKYGVTNQQLERDNGVINLTNLVPGQALVITYPSQTHIVKSGDTLSGIANAYGITLLKLLSLNSFLSERNNIYPGEELVISYPVSGPIVTHGYLFPYINRSVLVKTLPSLSYISVFNYTVTSNFDIVTSGEDSDIIKLAVDYGTIPIMMISTTTLQGVTDCDLVYEILLNKELQDQLISDILKLVTSKGYYGMNLLISGINTTNQNLYIELINKISSLFKKEDLLFFITINLDVQIPYENSSRDKLDYTTISNYVDGIVFLQYYWGTAPGQPTPVNNITQLKDYIKYVEKIMPKEKITIGVTLLGYDWTLPYIKDESIVYLLSLDGVAILAYNVNAVIRFDDISQTPYFTYQVPFPGGVIDHIVWFIDARSISSLLELISVNGIMGSGIWNIMTYNQQSWSLNNSQFDTVKYLHGNIS